MVIHTFSVAPFLPLWSELNTRVYLQLPLRITIDNFWNEQRDMTCSVTGAADKTGEMFQRSMGFKLHEPCY